MVKQMKKKLSIRGRIYINDLKRVAIMKPLEKLKTSLELSDFCRYLESKIYMKNKYGRA